MPNWPTSSAPPLPWPASTRSMKARVPERAIVPSASIASSRPMPMPLSSTDSCRLSASSADDDPRRRVVAEQRRLGDRLVAQLLAGIRGVGDQLAQENVPVGIDRVDHQMQEPRNVRLETAFFRRRCFSHVPCPRCCCRVLATKWLERANFSRCRDARDVLFCRQVRIPIAATTASFSAAVCIFQRKTANLPDSTAAITTRFSMPLFSLRFFCWRYRRYRALLLAGNAWRIAKCLFCSSFPESVIGVIGVIGDFRRGETGAELSAMTRYAS